MREIAVEPQLMRIRNQHNTGGATMYDNNENDYLKIIQLEGFIQAAKNEMHIAGSLNISLEKYAEFARLVEHHANRPLTPREWRFIDDQCVSEIRRNDYSHNANLNGLYGVAFSFDDVGGIIITFIRRHGIRQYVRHSEHQRVNRLLVALRHEHFDNVTLNDKLCSVYYSKFQVE